MRNQINVDENTIIIEVSNEKYETNGKSLKYYMDCMQDDGIIEYVLSVGISFNV